MSLLAIVGSISGVITGWVGLANVRVSRRGGKALAILAIILSGLFLLLALVTLMHAGVANSRR